MKKRNTKKFRKKLKMRNSSKPLDGKRLRNKVLSLKGFKEEFPNLSDNVYRFYKTKEFWDDDTKDILFVPSYKSLPSSVVDEIEKHITKYPIRKGRCHPNSSLLSLNIEGVNTCRGWYSDNVHKWIEYGLVNGFDDVLSHYYNILKTLKKEQSKGNDWVIMNPTMWGDEKCNVNTKTGDWYMSHSWNEYNGVYFDITREFHNKYMNIIPWKKYRLKSIDDYKSLTENTKYSERHPKINLNRINSIISGSGLYEFHVEKDEHFVMNDHYKTKYVHRDREITEIKESLTI